MNSTWWFAAYKIPSSLRLLAEPIASRVLSYDQVASPPLHQKKANRSVDTANRAYSQNTPWNTQGNGRNKAKLQDSVNIQSTLSKVKVWTQILRKKCERSNNVRPAQKLQNNGVGPIFSFKRHCGIVFLKRFIMDWGLMFLYHWTPKINENQGKWISARNVLSKLAVSFCVNYYVPFFVNYYVPFCVNYDGLLQMQLNSSTTTQTLQGNGFLVVSCTTLTIIMF